MDTKMEYQVAEDGIPRVEYHVAEDGIPRVEYHVAEDGIPRVQYHVAGDGIPRDDYASSSDTKLGTLGDRQDMERIGKIQELRRNFRYLSIVGFTAGMMCTWEAVLATSGIGLSTGGPGGYFWTFFGVLFGFSLVILSMAEMSSIAPTSGGQYHWVSEFAPQSVQRFLSFMTGWICVMGWQATLTSACFFIATQIQGMIVLADDTYVFERWHGTLLTVAAALTVFAINTLARKWLPAMEVAVLALHIIGFLLVLIPLWVLAPTKQPASVIFTHVINHAGWSSSTLACFVGTVGPVFTLIGPDAAVHMAEEVRDAAKVLPVGMLTTLVLNGVLGLAMIITLNGVTQDLDDALSTATTIPYIQVFHQATGSVAGTICLSCIITFQFMCATVAVMAAASRQLFAFTRDGGLPLSSFFCKVKPGVDIPFNALLFSIAMVVALSLINIGSFVAFNAIISLSVAALMTSYLISTTCYLIAKLRRAPMPPARWSMGWWSVPINIGAIGFLLIVLIFSFFPTAVPVTPQTLNYSVVIYTAVVLAALADYAFRGRHVYQGPVVTCKVE